MSLQSLASNKVKDPSKPQKPTSPKRLADRLLAWLPLYLVIGFLALAWPLFGDRIAPGHSVELVTVVTQKAGADSTTTDNAATKDDTKPADSFAGSVLFQASGWIEADPLPVRATALLDGVVEEVFALEGENVEVGQLLATLIADDAEIALLEAEARLAEAQAEAKREESRVRQAEAQLKTHALQVATLKAELEILRDDATRFESAGSRAFAERDVRQARLRVLTGEAEMAALEAREAELDSEQEAMEQAVETARRRIDVAQAMVQRAELDLSRTRVESPITGVIQELYVAPGRKRMLGMDDPESATIAKLFQPDSLQARIDVPLEEAAQLFIDQPVIVRTNLLPNREFRGFVTRIVGMADIQRNTLQAKVALKESDPRMRPDMLCRAEFLSPARTGGQTASGGSASGGRVLVFVPEEALLEHNGNSAVVWTLGQRGETAERRNVQLGSRSRDGYVEVTKGLRPGDPVIANPPTDLEPGDRVRPKNP